MRDITLNSNAAENTVAGQSTAPDGLNYKINYTHFPNLRNLLRFPCMLWTMLAVPLYALDLYARDLTFITFRVRLSLSFTIQITMCHECQHT